MRLCPIFVAENLLTVTKNQNRMKHFFLSVLFAVTSLCGFAQSAETVVFTGQGWSEGMELQRTILNGTACKVTFMNRGGNYGNPSFDGTAVSLFGRNVLKIESGRTIVKVIFTYGKGKPRTKQMEDGRTDVNYAFSGGSYSETTRTWEGSANQLTLEKRKGRGQLDIVKMEIFYR